MKLELTLMRKKQRVGCVAPKEVVKIGPCGLEVLSACGMLTQGTHDSVGGYNVQSTVSSKRQL